MNQTPETPAIATIRKFVTTLRQSWWLLAVPFVAAAIASLSYALLRPSTWEATQPLHVRDEASGGKPLKRIGEFDTPDSMKTAQETILEVAKNQQVISAALVELGPPEARTASGEFPTGLEIEELRKNIRLSPPKGAELGRTEIIYLAVKDHSRARAIALTTAVCNQLEARLKELRINKAQSMISELEKTEKLAKADLDTATTELEAMETLVGPDLGELRVLNEAGAGESNLRSALNQIKSELRQAETLRNTNVELLKFLRAARLDASELVAAPNRLLESQPSLKRLKEGLVDAQLRTAEVLANRTLEHPKVQAALMAEQLVQGDLHKELDTAIRGLDADLIVNDSHIESLETQAAGVTARLERLSGLRARYANLVADVKQRSEILERSKKDLADARATQAGAVSVSLLTRLDAPQTGNYPVGPGRTTIVLGGSFGGLLLGVGLVFLVTPLGNFRGRRFSDYLGFGRRATDMKRQSDARLPAANRASDSAAAVAAVSRRAEDREFVEAPPVSVMMNSFQPTENASLAVCLADNTSLEFLQLPVVEQPQVVGENVSPALPTSPTPVAEVATEEKTLVVEPARTAAPVMPARILTFSTDESNVSPLKADSAGTPLSLAQSLSRLSATPAAPSAVG